MPIMDGYEFTKTLRDGCEDLPILMISAKQLPEDRKKGFLAGIDDYMVKPVDQEELLLHVKALLRRAKINICNPNSIFIPGNVFCHNIHSNFC